MTPPLLFDRALVRKRRDRAAGAYVNYDFLCVEMAQMLEDSLSFVARQFTRALLIGCGHADFGTRLVESGKVHELVQADISAAMLARHAGARVACDEEALPFALGSFDAVLCLGTLHWVNDVPGMLAQIHHVLQPDGLLMAVFPGGDSLHELKHSMTQGSIAREGGLSPRFSPMIDVRDAGALLQRAGFALPVADSTQVQVSYPDALALLRDLRGMGEANALIERPRAPLKRGTLAAWLEYYHFHYADAEQRLPATFDLITMTGWKPHASQQQPARRGSGQVSLNTVLS